jgi:putative SOS response-associated peptidase YedK
MARAESVADKPMFRTAFKERRCVVTAAVFPS